MASVDANVTISMSDILSEIVTVTSNVIEIQPDKQYLFVFKGATNEQVARIRDLLCSYGFDKILCISVPDSLEIIEVKEKNNERNH